MQKIIAAIKRGISRRPREIESVLAFECSMKWDELLKVDGGESQRFCITCSKNVYLTDSDLAYKENAKRGRCVSIPAGTELNIEGKEVITDKMIVGGLPMYDEREPRDDWKF